MTRGAVLAYLKKRPGSTCFEIARGLEVKSPFVSIILSELRELGQVESAGQTNGTRWALAATKPPRKRSANRRD